MAVTLPAGLAGPISRRRHGEGNSRRLPGFRFEAQAPATDTLPRMDVAVFVGFAASGPLDTPVPLEDVAQFRAIFGPDATLAWDEGRGEAVYALLGPTVRAFFRNGGRRCWIIRVAREARANFFPIPGLAQLRSRAGGAIRVITPAFVQARSEGSWSDDLRVGAALSSRRVRALGVFPDVPAADLLLAGADEIATGDLLRFTFRATGEALLFAVESVEPLEPGTATRPWGWAARVEEGRPRRAAVRVSGSAERSVWLRAPAPSSPPITPSAARVYKSRARVRRFTVVRPLEVGPDGRSVDLTLAAAAADAPAPGALVRVDAGGEQLWLTVGESRVLRAAASPPVGAPPVDEPAPLDGSPPDDGTPPLDESPPPIAPLREDEVVQVRGEGFWWLRSGPDRLPTFGPADVAERLTFELSTWDETEPSARLAELGFAEGHPRYWDGLPTDEALFRIPDYPEPTGASTAYPDLRAAASRPRFPLAGTGVRSRLSFPLAMPALPENHLAPFRLTATPLERDGLDDLDPPLFLDGQLWGVTTSTLLAQADYVRYESPRPRPLHGIHAALRIEEASLIAVPDALQRGWRRSPEPAPPAPPEPGWLPPLEGDASPPLEPEAAPDFAPCATGTIRPPRLAIAEEPTSGVFTLAWSAEADATFLLEESLDPRYRAAAAVYQGAAGRLTLHRRSEGDYYYRVRSSVDGALSDWSNGVVVRIAPSAGWLANRVGEYLPDTLLMVQRAALRLCAARGDMLAVLGLPEHYREDDAIAHAAALTAPLGSPLAADVVPPLGTGEARSLSYGALYHPWLVMGRDEHLSLPRRTPPDGAACGVLAQRALTRGAWIAPANEPLGGVLALVRPTARERWLDLQGAQVNVLRQEPRGFLTLSADTLSLDADLRPINVRRLLTLLRRLALRVGPSYVFEPNDDAFRRMIQRGFEEVLDQLYLRGAFAGATASAAYRVDASALNTPRNVEQGQFIVELRVAPSLPMTFLTVRLVHSGERTAVTEER